MDGTQYDFRKLAAVRSASYTQVEFAKLVRVHVVTLNRVENGHNASFELITKICQLLDIDSSRILYSSKQITA